MGGPGTPTPVSDLTASPGVPWEGRGSGPGSQEWGRGREGGATLPSAAASRSRAPTVLGAGSTELPALSTRGLFSFVGFLFLFILT